MKRVLFIDRDGTLIIEPPDEKIDSFEKLDYYPGIFAPLGRIARSGMYELVMVTNQDGLGTPGFPESAFEGPHQKMLRTFENEGIHFSNVFIDRSLPHENKPTRKPGTAMLTGFLQDGYDLKRSFVIGDRITDVVLARNLGATGILLGPSSHLQTLDQQGLRDSCALVTTSWEDIYQHVCLRRRTASIHRKTHETDISVSINLDGKGQAQIDTGLSFFNHMLEQLARHGKMDLSISAKGDLHVDEHHTIEDTALALGEAVALALDDKKGITRYGYYLPMDDASAQVALDFGGRPWLVWKAEFKREKIGELPTEMFMHFFKSFTDAAKCNLHITAEGQNEHHKIEAIFKAWAKSIHMASRTDGSDIIPTTKGKL